MIRFSGRKQGCENQASWELTLERLKACRRPPAGYGNGFARAQQFLRRFRQGQGRLARLGELRSLVDKLQRQELEKVVDAVNLLQESRAPDDIPVTS